MRLLVIAALLLLSGCATGVGTKWYAPATWFSHRPADTVDKAIAKQDAAADKAVKAAQKATHETAYALAQAPASRPVAIAVQSNDTAMRLLDQVAGPLTTQEAAALQSLVNRLMSENEEIRLRAEKERAKSEKDVAKISEDLGKTQAALARAQGNLRDAFERENALANELRAQRALLWIGGTIAVLLGAAFLYVKVVYGGLPSAAGLLMRDLRTKHPETARVVEPLFDTYLSRREQRLVSRYAE